MSVRAKVGLLTIIGLALIGLVVFLLGPVLFASVAYPLPDNFRAPLANRAQQYGLNPNTLAALTFVESGFNLNAHSGAGAIGPTQFLPSTARGVAARLGVSPFSPTDLTTNPDLAEWFAAYYVSTDIKNYGNLHLALVAYNGGGAAANASARGYGFAGPEAYANKIQAIQSAYQAIYGNWWQGGVPSTSSSGSSSSSSASSAPQTQTFTVQPSSGLSLITSGSLLSIWQGLITSQAGNSANSATSSTTPTPTSGDITNLWKALIPGT